ncbi:uncharacterized protein LOC123539896 [Mercenaria mercenaria]|uniref:uncharacterized protein LOC123539896 n=1 Tax=Mercenaria mercenaria TaxID=6596 RepID=UPI00234E3CC3|nr:uncharacterized protein LOC123539896 [Mercenaria mercenaria]
MAVGPLCTVIPQTYHKYLSRDILKSYLSQDLKYSYELEKNVQPADIPIITKKFDEQLYPRIQNSLNDLGKQVIMEVHPWIINTLVDWDNFDDKICIKDNNLECNNIESGTAAPCKLPPIREETEMKTEKENTGQFISQSNLKTVKENTGQFICQSNLKTVKENTGQFISQSNIKTVKENTGQFISQSNIKTVKENTGQFISQSNFKTVKENTGQFISQSNIKTVKENTGQFISQSNFRTVKVNKDQSISPTNLETVKQNTGQSICQPNVQDPCLVNLQECDGAICQSSSSSDGTVQTKWPKEKVLKLIDLHAQYEQMFSKPSIKKKHVWALIAAKLCSDTFNVTIEKAEQKWKNLTKNFRDTIDHNNKSGSAPKHCPYFEELQEVYGYRPNVKPVFTGTAGCSESFNASSNSSERSTVEDTEGSSEEGNNIKKAKKMKRQNKTDVIVEFLKEMKTDMVREQEMLLETLNRQHEARMKNEDKKLELIAQLVKAVKK